MLRKRICAVIVALLFSLTLADETRNHAHVNVMCGPHCLWLAAKSYGITTTLKKLRYFAETHPSRGTSLKSMLKALRQIGLEPLLVNTDWHGLQKIRRPCILLLNQPANGHYVFLERIDSETIGLISPPDRYTWPRSEFVRVFTGNVIAVCRDTEDKNTVARHFKPNLTANLKTRAAVFLTVLLSGTLILLITRPWNLLFNAKP